MANVEEAHLLECLMSKFGICSRSDIITLVVGPNIFHRNPHSLFRWHTIQMAKSKEKQHGFTDDKLLSMKPCRSMVLFIQTLPRILCHNTTSCVGFYGICLDLSPGLLLTCLTNFRVGLI